MCEDLYKTKELIARHGTTIAEGKKITHVVYILSLF